MEYTVSFNANSRSEADSRSATHGILRNLWNPKVRPRVNNSPRPS